MTTVNNNLNQLANPPPVSRLRRSCTIRSESSTYATSELAKKALSSSAQVNSNKITPEKYYPVTEDGILAVSPTAAKASRVIYVILNTKTGQRYVGKTEQELRKRLHSHNFGIAHPEKEIGQKALYQELRENPEDFQIGILCKVEEGEDIIERERELIAEKNAYDEGYNETRGGGAKKTGSGTATLPDDVPTPKKYYPFRAETLKFELSPTAKKAKKVVYVIFDQATGRRYVGKTEQELRQRFNSHHFHVAHPDKENGDFELYQEMRLRPQDFFAGILYEPPGEEDDLEVLEAYLIEQKEAYAEGYNRTGGTKLNFDE